MSYTMIPPVLLDNYKKAEKWVRTMDESDGGESHLPVYQQLATIQLALQAGLIHPEGNSHYDALVMLNELRERLIP